MTSAVWTKGAQGYLRSNAARLGQFSRDALDLVNPPRPSRILEIACGPGILSFEAAYRKVGSSIITTDFSEGMVDIVRARIKEEDPSLVGVITPQIEDAHTLSGIPDASQDYIYSMFGMFIVPDRAAALKSAHRVLVPGGTLVGSFWDFKDTEPGLARLGGVNRSVMRSLPIKSRPPQLPPVFGITPDDIIREIKEAGFIDVELKRVTHTFCYSSKEVFTEGWTIGNPMVNGALENATEEELAFFKNEIIKAVYFVDDAKDAKGGCAVEFPGLIFIARKPE